MSFTTRVFLWDGANSIVSRNKAAAGLARELERLAIQHPNDPIVIVAHSHGGNVALRAAHIAGKPSIENLRVITITTPFLQIRTYTSFYEDGVAFDTPYSKSVVDFLEASIALVLAVLIAGIAHFFGFVLRWGGWSAAYLLGCVIAKPLTKLIVNPFPTYKGTWRKYDSSPEGWAYKPDRLENLSYYSMPRADYDWLLVLRGVDDEASLSLAAGAIGNRMTHLFLGILLPSLFWMSILVNFVGWTFGADWRILGLAGLYLSAIIATALLFLPGCFRSVFGRELLLGCWRCEIFADSAPDTTVGVRVRTFLRAGSEGLGLKHALYKNPEIAPYIAAWLTASVQGKNELAD